MTVSDVCSCVKPDGFYQDDNNFLDHGKTVHVSLDSARNDVHDLQLDNAPSVRRLERTSFGGNRLCNVVTIETPSSDLDLFILQGECLRAVMMKEQMLTLLLDCDLESPG